MGRNWLSTTFLMATLAAACGESGTDTATDAGNTNDAGRVDSGTPDGGNANDSGTPTDSGPTDTGAAPVCGNNVIESGEGCDDGNLTAGDGCDSSCDPEGSVIGCRSMAISTGEDGNDPDDSAYLNTALNPNTDISEFLTAGGWSASGPLVLCAGALANGKAPLTLQGDVTVAISLPLNNCLCRQYVAAGTEGSLYCEAGAAPLDFKATADSMGDGAAGPFVVQNGAGTVRGEGDLRITFMSRAANLEVGRADCTPAACATAVAGIAAEPLEYGTGMATSEVTNARQGGVATISTQGAPFDDDPNDGTPDCEDWTQPGALGVLAGGASFDEDNMDLGNPEDVVTVERVAE